MPRLLLLLPTTTYRTAAFLGAAKKLGVEVVVASERAHVFQQAQPGRFLSLDFLHPDQAARQVVEFVATRPIHAVVGVDDATTVLAAVLLNALGLPHNPLRSTAAARDKYRMRTRLRGDGVPVPPYALRSFDDDPVVEARRTAFPCVVKPLMLSGSRGVIRADDEAQFVGAVRRLERILRRPEAADDGEAARQVLVEGFIPGREVSLEGLLVKGDLHVLALFDKPDPLDGPFFEETIYVAPSRLPSTVQAEIASCTARAAQALGLRDGPVHAELRVNRHGPSVIEIAAAWRSVRRQWTEGLDIARAALRPHAAARAHHAARGSSQEDRRPDRVPGRHARGEGSRHGDPLARPRWGRLASGTATPSPSRAGRLLTGHALLPARHDRTSISIPLKAVEKALP